MCISGHNWKWHYDCFEDARQLDGDCIGIPVKCIDCGKEGVEWYTFLCVGEAE